MEAKRRHLAQQPRRLLTAIPDSFGLPCLRGDDTGSGFGRLAGEFGQAVGVGVGSDGDGGVGAGGMAAIWDGSQR